MKKFVTAVLGAGLVVALMPGTASAQLVACPNPQPHPDGATLAERPPGAVGLDQLWVAAGGGNLAVGGSLSGTGHGWSRVGGIGTTNLTYDGELVGTGVGHGEISNASVGTGGVSGDADGRLGNVVVGEGSLDTNGDPILTATGGVPPSTCVTVSVP